MEQLRFWYFLQPRAIRKLLLLNVVAYLVWNLVFVHFQVTALFVYNQLALNADYAVVVFKPWQLLSYSFLHLGSGLGGFLHLLFNMLWLVWIGRDFEQIYGAPRLLNIYVMGSIGGALATIALHAIFPDISSFGGIVNGASASVIAVMTLVAVVQPQKSVSLMFIGIIRLRYIVIGFLFLDILWASSGGTSISAHWGGALAGLVVGKLFLSGTDLSSWAISLFESQAERSQKSIKQRQGISDQEKSGIMNRLEGWASGKSTGRTSGNTGGSARFAPSGFSERLRKAFPEKGGETAGAATANQTKIDAILDKISASGYEALTEDEKQILFEAGDQ